MRDLSGKQLEYLAYMAASGDDFVVIWGLALELQEAGMVALVKRDGGYCFDVTDAGRAALLRAKEQEKRDA